MKVLLALLLLTALPKAQAKPYGHVLTSCVNDDGTTQVTIYSNPDSSLGAVVRTESFGGSYPTFSYKILMSEDSKRTLTRFTGSGIDMEVLATGAGQLEVPKLSINDNVICK